MNPKRLIPIAVVACSCALVPAAIAKPKAGVTYTGVTSQGDASCRQKSSNDQPCTVSARVNKTGKRVAVMQVYFKAECEDGKVFRSSTVFKRARIKNSRFKVNAKYDESLSDGTRIRNTVTTSGKFGKRLKGTYSITSKLTFSDGSTTTCSSGNVTFTASPSA